MLHKIVGTEINYLREYLNKLWKYKHRNHMQNTLKMDYLNYSFSNLPQNNISQTSIPKPHQTGFLASRNGTKNHDQMMLLSIYI